MEGAGCCNFEDSHIRVSSSCYCQLSLRLPPLARGGSSEFYGGLVTPVQWLEALCVSNSIHVAVVTLSLSSARYGGVGRGLGC
jgi:hypothetical protein